MTARSTWILAVVAVIVIGIGSAFAVRMAQWGPHSKSLSLAELEERTELEIGRPMPELSLVDLEGNEHSLAGARGDVVVLVVHGNACPCSEAYVGRLNEIVDEYSDRGVRVWAFNPNDNETEAESRTYVEEKDVRFTVAHDPESKIADQLLAACMTEAWLVDREGILRYHGRIDDNIFKPQEVESADLLNALNAIVEGKEVPLGETTATGCTIHRAPRVAPLGT